MLEQNMLAYNASVYNVLSDKNYLAHLLKRHLNEYSNLDIESIIKLMGEIATKDDVYKVYGLSNKDTSFFDGTVEFDLLFPMRNPEDDSSTALIVNLELQKEANDTNLKRMIYYCSRIIMSEKGRIFKDDEYQNIKKVVAIWICVKPKKELRDCINRYAFNEICIQGDHHEDVENYDLIEVNTLYLGNKLKDSILVPLNILFKANMKPNEIFDLLEKEYDIKLHRETKKEVDNMCNLGEGLYKEGIEQGIEQGKLVTIIENLKNLMEALNLSFDEAALALKVPEELKEYCRQSLTN